MDSIRDCHVPFSDPTTYSSALPIGNLHRSGPGVHHHPLRCDEKVAAVRTRPNGSITRSFVLTNAKCCSSGLQEKLAMRARIGIVMSTCLLPEERRKASRSGVYAAVTLAVGCKPFVRGSILRPARRSVGRAKSAIDQVLETLLTLGRCRFRGPS
jgi:hypothetical protein